MAGYPHLQNLIRENLDLTASSKYTYHENFQVYGYIGISHGLDSGKMSWNIHNYLKEDKPQDQKMSSINIL